MYAIKPNGIGNPVGFRVVKSDWPLVEGETFQTDVYPEGKVLAEDGVSLRAESPSEIETRESEAIAKEVARAGKMTGVLFNGVMCSATSEDMWGLSSIKDYVEAGNSTPFVFANGNTLTLTPSNIAAFQAVWIPFRQSFFA